MKPFCTLPRLLLLLLALVTLTTAKATQEPILNQSEALFSLQELQSLQKAYALRMDEHYKFLETRSVDLEETLNYLESVILIDIDDLKSLIKRITESRGFWESEENLLRFGVPKDFKLFFEGMDLVKEMRQEMRDLESWTIAFKERVEKATRDFAEKRRS